MVKLFQLKEDETEKIGNFLQEKEMRLKENL